MPWFWQQHSRVREIAITAAKIEKWFIKQQLTGHTVAVTGQLVLQQAMAAEGFFLL